MPAAELKPAVAAAAAATAGGEKSVLDADPREGTARYAPYAARLGQLGAIAGRVASVRHLAYTSDLGEAFRPVVPRWAVNATYGIAIGCAAMPRGYQLPERSRARRATPVVPTTTC